MAFSWSVENGLVQGRIVLGAWWRQCSQDHCKVFEDGLESTVEVVVVLLEHHQNINREIGPIRSYLGVLLVNSGLWVRAPLTIEVGLGLPHTLHPSSRTNASSTIHLEAPEGGVLTLAAAFLIQPEKRFNRRRWVWTGWEFQGASARQRRPETIRWALGGGVLS